MATEFVQPRLTGARFNEHTLPLEVAKDLVAYETLIVALAKSLYKKSASETRQRIPKNFAKDFHLHIQRIDDGCARPMLSTVVSEGQMEFFDEHVSYFVDARDLISDCIMAVSTGSPLPDAFPRSLLTHFNKFGRSLRYDEALELPTKSGSVAALTQSVRKKLVLASERYYESEVELIGVIEEVDWAKNTFRLKNHIDGSTANIPMTEDMLADVREYGGKSRHALSMVVTAEFDSNDKLHRVSSVSEFEIQKSYELTRMLEDLAKLKAGWMNGEGSALNSDSIQSLTDILTGCYPEDIALPIMVPTPDGNLLLEWNVDGSPSLDVNLSNMQGYFHCFDSSGHDIDIDCELSSVEKWTVFFETLGNYIGSGR